MVFRGSGVLFFIGLFLFFTGTSPLVIMEFLREGGVTGGGGGKFE